MALSSKRACIGSLNQSTSTFVRSFSTASRRLQNVPPDSPLYIRLPTPPQTDEKKRERVRGFLPVPREIFPRKGGQRKLEADYLNKTIPKPKSDKTGSAESQWKAQVAQSRRKGLEEGLSELWNRHSVDRASRVSRSRANFQRNHDLAIAPERHDDRLTRGTTLEALMDTKVYSDPNRFARADRSRDKVLAAQNFKREVRRDALMELYISASNFITNEAELKEEIDTIFQEDYFKNQSQARQSWGAANAWGIYGRPQSVAGMLDASTKTSTRISEDVTDHDRSSKRQKRIAEEFTGGKM